MSYTCPPTPEALPYDPTPPPLSEMEASAGGEERPKKIEQGEVAVDLRMPSPVRRPSSPEPVCSICLDHLENMSCTNSCLHKFCFTCLLEWSKVKPECPLCKSKFTSIIHTIVSDDRYESYELPERPPAAPMPAVIPLDPSEVEEQRFRYGSTMTGERIRARHMHRQLMAELALPDGSSQQQQHLPHLPPSLQLPSGAGGATTSAGPMWRRRRGRATSEFRRDVYERSLYVDPESVADVTGRFRECSPEWFRNNEASTHRLVPWLNRELNVVLINGSQHSSYVIQLIIDTLQRHEIASPEFLELLQPYMGSRTGHFQHEFYHYARSVYDMVGFDRHAIYTERREQTAAPATTANRATVVVITSSEENADDDDDDVVVLDGITRTGADGEIQSHATGPPPSVSDRREALNSLTERIRQRLLTNGGTLTPRIPFPTPAVEETPTSTPPEGEGATTPPLPPAFDGPSTSSGETSSNFQRLVIPDDNSSDDSTIDVVFETQGSRTPLTPPPPPPPPSNSLDRIPEVVHLSSSDEDPVVRTEKVRLRIRQVSSEPASEEDSSGRRDAESQKKMDSLSRRKSKNQRQKRKEMEMSRRRSGVPSGSSSSDEGDEDEDVVQRFDERRRRRNSRKKKRKSSDSKKERAKEKGKGKGKRSAPKKESSSEEEEDAQTTPGLISEGEGEEGDDSIIENMMMNSTLGDATTDVGARRTWELENGGRGGVGKRQRRTRGPSAPPSPERGLSTPPPPSNSKKRPLGCGNTANGVADEDDDVPLSMRFYPQGRLKSRVRKRKSESALPVVKEEPVSVKQEKQPADENQESKEDLRLLLRRKRQWKIEEPAAPSVMSMAMHVENHDWTRQEESDYDFEVWRRNLIAKKKKRMT